MKRRTLWLAPLALLVAGLASLPLLSKMTDGTTESAAAPIQRLREAGRYGEAREAAHQLESALLADSRAPAWQREDAARLVETCTRAAAWPESARVALAEADRLDSEIHLLTVQGHYRRAYALATRQLETRRRLFGEEHAETATSMVALAAVTYRRGDRAGAAELNERALKLRRQLLGEHHPQIAESEAALGHAEKGLSHKDRAEALHSAALKLRRELFGEQSHPVAESLFDLSDIHRWVGEYDAALEALDQGLRILRKLHQANDPDIARGLCGIGLVHSIQGRWTEAEPYLRAAADADARVPDTPVENQSLSASLLAEALMRRGALAEAERYTLASLQISEALRREGLPGFPPSHALADWWRVATYQLEQGKEEEAWSSLERSLNRTLLDGLFPPDSSEAPGSIDWDASERKRFCTLAELQAHLPAEAAVVGWLEADRSFLLFSRYPYWAYVIRDTGPVSWIKVESPPGVPDGTPSLILRDFVNTFWSGANWPLRAPANPEFIRLARAAYAERIAPLLPHLAGVHRLYFVKAGSISPIPVETFVDSTGMFLGDQFVVSYIPSATSFVRMQARAHRERTAARWHALIVGDSPAGEEEGTGHFHSKSSRDEASRRLPFLPGARKEIRQIAPLFASAKTLAFTASGAGELNQFAQADSLRQFDLIHIATHVLTSPDGPMRSALALSTTASQQARAGDTKETSSQQRDLLLAQEILSSWRLDADLVTLSGCRGDPSSGVWTDPSGGISEALFLAGARSVLVSLCTVDDAATALLMRRFYENLTGAYRDERAGRVSAPMFKSLALQEAKRYVREYRDPDGTRPFENPIYWAAFVLVGDPGIDPSESAWSGADLR